MAHLAFKIDNGLLGLKCGSLAEESRTVAAASCLAHNGYKSLARDIATENQDICLVEFRGVDKYEETSLQNNDIACYADRPAPTLSGAHAQYKKPDPGPLTPCRHTS